jgi:TrmH family RNA methyltransferase
MDYLSKAEQARIRLLGKKRDREEQGRFIAEGIKVCKELLNSNITIQYAVIPDDAKDQVLSLADEMQLAGIEVCLAGTTAFERMTDANSPQGIICIAELPSSRDNVPATFLALEDINDPGNLGTIIRTADWFGMSSIMLGGNCADAFGPKAIRAAMGSTFRMNIIVKEHLAPFLDSWKNAFPKGEILGLLVKGEQSLHEVQYLPENWGIIMGSESHGVSDLTAQYIAKRLRIDGSGSAESLNVGIATGITLYHCLSLVKKQ